MGSIWWLSQFHAADLRYRQPIRIRRGDLIVIITVVWTGLFETNPLYAKNVKTKEGGSEKNNKTGRKWGPQNRKTWSQMIWIPSGNVRRKMAQKSLDGLGDASSNGKKMARGGGCYWQKLIVLETGRWFLTVWNLVYNNCLWKY